MLRLVLLTAAAAAVIAGAVPEIQHRLAAADSPPTVAAAPAVRPAASGGSRLGDVVIPADARGHFAVAARAGGHRLDLLADTGATLVALRLADARRLGFHPAPADFEVPVSTANGVVKAARMVIPELSVGGIAVDRVEALVLPDEVLAGNLLGMSFLSRLSRFEVAGGRLVLSR